MASILPYTHDNITLAAAALERGEVVAFATETVYGLGALTFREQAIERIYELKGRPLNNPLISHVLDIQHARSVAVIEGWRPAELAMAFWPGPLTMILPKRPEVPLAATGGLETIAVRAPKHSLARALLHAAGTPISAPSANRSGRVSATLASHVVEDFGDADLMVLDGGACRFGIESTVLDLSGDRAVVLRLGAVGADAIAAVLGTSVEVTPGAGQSASPGSSEKHYAPRTPSMLIRRSDVERETAAGSVVVIAAGGLPSLAGADVEVIALPEDPDACAAALYEALRAADRAMKPRILIVEPEGEGVIWDAVRDRLRRAAMAS
ncbi:MAG: L-threonylcarbamoyladenylate synthase [Planctomycetota bacterium]|nr:L-threonylcarbamoyladenylate synthase [Planctomycetota bacterium]MDA1105303.1 L-threonylcarbamoyladenylate synthase [Planctomycetota bacterium]